MSKEQNSIPYPEPAERSAEFLRLAVASMAKHPAPWNPITYTVWYQYASGQNDLLKQEIDSTISRQVFLEDTMVRTLYAKYIVDAKEHATSKVSAELGDLLNNVEASAAQTRESVAAVNMRLTERSESISGVDDPQALRAMIADILAGTRDAGKLLAALSSTLHSTTSELEQLRQELQLARGQATVDALTGVANRRGFDDAAAKIMSELDPSAPAPVIAMIDLDHFKALNDSFGHVFGDRVLKAVAQAIVAGVKGRDIVARYGGEEFVVLLVSTPLQGAVTVANQIRETIAGAKIRRGSAGDMVGAVTVSIGLSSYQAGETIEQWIERADAALYRSKAAGRNRVTVAGA